jgi:Spy/CpxP family protein refolding chaperone
MLNFKNRVLKGLAAASIGLASLAAFAQMPPGGMEGHGGPGGKAPTAEQIAKFQQMRAKHQAQLHDKLKITAAQESAWKTFIDKTTPQRPDPAARPNKEDWAKLTTPERLDRRLDMMKKGQARAEQHIAATKEFYAALSPEQQKTFDAEFAKMERHRFERRHGPMGEHKGPHKGDKPAADGAPAPAR